MKTQILSIVAAAALLGAGSAAAATKTGQSEEVKALQAAGSGEKKVCKRLQVSGTRLAERTCLTKDEWKKLENMN